MPGVSGILSIASRSLWASQTGIEVASHNISNMNTPGYSRQGVVFDPSRPLQVNGLLLGTGVNARDVTAAQDRYLDMQMIRSQSFLGRSDARGRHLSSLEEIFIESDGTGISSSMARFFSSVQDLAANPEGQAQRTALVGAAKVLVNQFHIIDSRLAETQKSADNAVRDEISQVNNLAERLASLNRAIRDAEAGGQTAGDFRSARTELLRQLGQYIDFTSFEGTGGEVNVIVGGGMPLVEGYTAGKLVAVGNTEGFSNVGFQDIHGNLVDITDRLKGGSIAGNLEIRDGDTAALREKIDEMAYEFVTAFNTAHNPGFGLNGATGIDFFAPLATADGAAKAIAIDAAILADVNNIAASLTGEAGDNQNALILAEVEEAALFNGNTWTLQDFHGSIVGQVGVDAQAAMREADQSAAQSAQIEALRESVVGVTLEEEMADLMKFQHSYQAAARLFNVVDDMINVLHDLR
ncbi:flagellar hook-associated protein FlgK [bacterium]|nr:flagellar hook-associated protein FlgK [bacterium]